MRIELYYSCCYCYYHHHHDYDYDYDYYYYYCYYDYNYDYNGGWTKSCRTPNPTSMSLLTPL